MSDFISSRSIAVFALPSFEDISISRQDEDEDTASRRQRLLDRSSTYLKKTD